MGNEVIVPAERPAAPANQQSSLLSLLTAPRPALAKALAQAIQACSPVGHNAENTYHHYHYTSSEAIIEEGRKALAGAGLSLVPVEASLVGWDRDGPDRFELVRTFLLLHASGESAPLRVVWPVVPDKGRPLDKATAAADTLSLAYLLRDLLLMARVKEADEVQARDDRRGAPAAPKKAEPPVAAKGKPASTPHAKLRAEFAADVGKAEVGLIDNQLALAGELEKAILVALRIPSLAALADPDQIGKAREAMSAFVRSRLVEEVEHQMKRLELIGWGDAFQVVRQPAVAPDKATQKQLLALALALREEEMQPVGA